MPLTLNLQTSLFLDSPLLRISSALDGTQSNGISFSPMLSANGRYVVFLSAASNLVAGDTNNAVDVFRKDLMTGEVVRASTTSNWGEADKESYDAAISTDGRYVVFSSYASNLVAGDIENSDDIFLKDLVTGKLVRVSTSSAGVGGDSHSVKPKISADGRFVVFESEATNLAGDNSSYIKDIFVKDVVNNTLVRVSSAMDGSEANGESRNAQISADGRYVVFESEASNLVAGDTDIGSGGYTDIFIKDLKDNTLQRLSVATDGSEADGESLNAQISANGRYVVFESDASDMVTGADSGYRDIFRKDLETGEIIRVSMTADGAEADGESYNAQISADGRYVTFVSEALNLSSGDTNNSTDIFRKDLLTGEVVRLSTTSTPATGKEQFNGQVDRAQLSADGQYLIFNSGATNLVAGDTNGMGEVFLKNLATQEIIRVSTRADGSQLSDGSEKGQVSMSDKGHYVLFQSYASDLVEGDAGTDLDIFVKDLDKNAEGLNEIIRVSADRNGVEANGNSDNARFGLRDSGVFVVFESDATNLVENDTNGFRDLFLKDLTTREIVRISTDKDGVEANGRSMYSQVSADGRYVVFESDATNLVVGDTSIRRDIFRKDLLTQEVVRVSTSKTGGEANNASSLAQISGNGQYVVFESAASNLVAGDLNGKSDIFIKDLDPLNLDNIKLVSVAANGTLANGTSTGAKISSNGRFVAFVSYATNMVVGQTDSNEKLDIYLKDMQTGNVVRITTGLDGVESNGSYHNVISVSDDGQWVVFTSTSSNLVVGDTNNVQDIFRKNVLTGAIERLSMTNTDAQGNEAPNSSSSNVHIRLDGQFVVFQSSASNVTGGDANNVDDIYLSYGDPSYQQAMAEGRFVDLGFDVGPLSTVSMNWGDGSVDTVAPSLGKVFFRHAYETTGIKNATVTVIEGAQTWAVPYVINLTGKTAGRDNALFDTLSGGAGADTLVGDAFANIIIGDGGNDVLNGGLGADRMTGGAGNDTYYVHDAGDRVTETSTGGTADLVYASVTHTLASYVEKLYASGTSAINLTGNTLANTIKGNSGANKINGYTGKDTLYGGSGKDIFQFTTKASSSNVDKIADYSVTSDSIQLDNKYFSKLGSGTATSPKKLASSAFYKGARAHDANDRLIYDATKGYLYYDADGTGSSKQVLIATMSKGLKMAYAEFYVI